jgi:hypothetical protein
MTFIKNIATQSLVRVGWIPLLLISTALHVGVVLGFIVANLPTQSHPLGAPSNDTPSLTIQLRSEASIGQIVTSSAPAHIEPQQTKSVPVFSSTTSVSKHPAPSANAFALKDRAQLSGLRDAILSPPTAPHVDSRQGIVFILDISGSMYEPYAGSTRLALARQILAERIRDLRDGAPFAITVYGETARRSGPLVPASDSTRAAALSFINQEYDCGGGTNLPVGLALAQELDMGAIVLITDGDLNMAPAELLPRVQSIIGAAGHCPALAVIAIAPRPQTKDEQLLQALVDQEGGTYQTGPDSALTAALTPKTAVVATP